MITNPIPECFYRESHPYSKKRLRPRITTLRGGIITKHLCKTIPIPECFYRESQP